MHGVRVPGSQLELLEQRRRNRGLAHAGDRLDLTDVGDRHDPGDDGDLDPDRPGLGDELEVEVVVEEELGDRERRPGRHLLAQEAQVMGQVFRLGVHLREAGGAMQNGYPAEISAASSVE